MIRKMYSISPCVVLLAAALVARGESGPSPADVAASAKRAAVALEVIQSAAPAKDKAVPCKVLAVYGGPEAVPALAALLPDPELSSWSRIALEAIPGPEADAALRGALGRVPGRLRIGVVNSLGVRRDAEAVDALAGLMTGGDAELASAAAIALGRIGTPPAAKALEGYLDAAPAAVRSAVAEGCILVAEKALGAGNATEAARLYERVRKADVPSQRIYEATRGVILARGSGGVPLLIEQLRSADPGAFQLGLTVSRELPGKEMASVLLGELAGADAQRKPLLLLALADCGDPAALPAMLEAARSGPAGLRVAAIRAIQKMDAAGAAAVLLEAVSAEEPVGSAAAAALAVLSDPAVDREIAARLAGVAGVAGVAGAGHGTLIQLAGQRRTAAALPRVLAAAADADAGIRAAALGALGQMIEPGDLPKLIALAVAPKDPGDAKPAADALTAAATRMPDAGGTINTLLAASAKAPVGGRIIVLEVITAMGGPRALDAVAAAAKSSEPEMQDAGTRLLGDWLSADAAPVLLELAKTASDARYRVRTLRGYIRIGRQLDVPDEQRIEMVREAMQVAQRDEERKLAVDILRRVHNKESLALAVSLLGNRAVRDEAGEVAVAIGEGLAVREPAAVAAAMQRVIEARVAGETAARAKTLLSETQARLKK